MLNNIPPDTNESISDKIKDGGMENVDRKEVFNIEKIGKEQPLKNPRIIHPEDYDSLEELFSDIKIWWVKRYRKDPLTWRRYRRLLEDMSKHEIFPINVFDPNPDQVVAQLDYIEEEWKKQRDGSRDKSGTYAIINRYKAVKALMHSYGRLKEVKDLWNYTPPSAPAARPRIIPAIQTVHKLIHHKYSKDRYETKLYQYIALFAHIVGFRPASEISILRTGDVDLETGLLTFYQPKPDNWRTVKLPDRLIDSSNTKCLKKWLDSWRPKAESQYSKDFMFIQPDTGKPFTEAFITKKMREMYLPVWTDYYPYSSRHWYATGSLVKTKVEHGIYGTKEVCDDMHHSSVSVTENYIRTADQWFKIAPFDWFKALLKFQTQMEQHKTLESVKKPVNPKNRGVLGIFPPVEGYGSAESQTVFLLLKLPAKSCFICLLVFRYYSLKPFSFFSIILLFTMKRGDSNEVFLKYPLLTTSLFHLTYCYKGRDSLSSMNTLIPALLLSTSGHHTGSNPDDGLRGRSEIAYFSPPSDEGIFFEEALYLAIESTFPPNPSPSLHMENGSIKVFLSASHPLLVGASILHLSTIFGSLPPEKMVHKMVHYSSKGGRF